MRRYRAYVRAAIAVSLQYRASVFARLAVTVVMVMLLTQIWTAVYRDRSTLAGYELRDTVVYITLAGLAAMLFDSMLPGQIADRIRTGEVLFDIARPIGYLSQMLSLQAGHSVTTAGFILVTAPFAALVGGLDPPADVVAGVAALAAVLLGWVLSALLALVVGLTAFWTVENNAFVTLFRLVAAFLAGSTVPLDIFPGPLLAVANALPFRFVAYDPVAIYIGRTRGVDIWVSLGLAAFWIALIGLLAVGMWRRAHRRVVVQGG